MKILIVSPTLDPINGGGVAERSFQLGKHLAAQDNEVSILTLDLGLTPERRAQCQPVQLYILPCWNQRFYIPKNGMKTIEKLVKTADVIHLMSHWTVLNAITYFYIRKHHKTYFFCPAGAYKIYGRSKSIKHLYNVLVGKKILQHAYAVIAITSLEAEELAKDAKGAKICVIPNGINPEDYQVIVPNILTKKYGITQPYILFLGRLNAIKGPDLLLEAFAKVKDQLPEYQLIFAGPDDGLKQILLDKISELSLSTQVSLIGHIDSSAKTTLLSQAELLVIPSRSEAMSIVVLEAGMVGTMALVTDTCGVNELATTGGVYIVPVSVEAISAGLVRLLKQPKIERMQFGRNLQNYVLQEYTWQNLIKKYIEIFP